MERINRTPEKPTPPWMPHEYALEDETDAANLPTGEGIPTGSFAYTGDGKHFYVLGAGTTREWTDWLAEDNGGSGGTGTP